MLSPNWANIWPADCTPAAYGTAKLRKIAMLVTDGVYNTLQAHSYGDNSSQAETARNQAVELCSKMKDKGIGIYTVGFQLDNDKAKTMLSSCATSTDHNYSAANGDQLEQAFRDIALKIAFLRLTHQRPSARAPTCLQTAASSAVYFGGASTLRCGPV